MSSIFLDLNSRKSFSTHFDLITKKQQQRMLRRRTALGRLHNDHVAEPAAQIRGAGLLLSHFASAARRRQGRRRQGHCTIPLLNPAGLFFVSNISIILLLLCAETEAHGRSHSPLPGAQLPDLCCTEQIPEKRQQQRRRRRRWLERGACALFSATAASNDVALPLSRSHQTPNGQLNTAHTHTHEHNYKHNLIFLLSF